MRHDHVVVSMPRIEGTGMVQVLVLNASYEPLNITTWRRAIVMMIKGKAESIEEDSSRILRADTMLPTVIRLRQFVKVPFRELPLTRKHIFERDRYTCQYCGTSSCKLSIDHVLPRSRGGADIWENVTTCCLTCNVSKGNRTPKEANMNIKSEPRRPLNNFHFQARKQIESGMHTEWRKYLIGWN